jgi:GNAT superfamily N-acetyltransferase
MGQPQLEMERAGLDGLPEVATPAGYGLRTYRPGDAPAWCRLVNEGIGGEWTEERFEDELRRGRGSQSDDIFFAEAAGDAVGTAWALREADSSSDAGWVHMVAVAPEHRGRGLGRALVTCVLRRLRLLGLGRALLRTDDFRLPAIMVYLKLGFRPLLTHESHRERWRQVYCKLHLDEKEAAE